MLKKIEYDTVGWNMLIHLNMMNYVYKYGSNFFATDKVMGNVDEKRVVTINSAGFLALCEPDQYPVGVCTLLEDGLAYVQILGEATVATSTGIDTTLIGKYAYVDDTGYVNVSQSMSDLYPPYRIIGVCTEVINASTIKVVLEGRANHPALFPEYVTPATLFYEGSSDSPLYVVKLTGEVDLATGNVNVGDYLYEGTEGVSSTEIVGNRLSIEFIPTFSFTPVYLASHYHSTPSSISVNCSSTVADIFLFDLNGNPLDWLSGSENPKIFFLAHGE